MHLHWERSMNSTGDCSITDLSWMGKVPDEIPSDQGWKLSRSNYYQEGWLATANLRGIVGITYTSSFSGANQNKDLPGRTNFNLRGHRSEVTLVAWNEPYQKLASCDSSGIIFVWIKYEGRWSIELINDRNTPVKSFAWSHDGRMALICYQDGFVLVGSVAGQRYWSTILPNSAVATCGIWTPDDNQVYIGTVQGDILVMDVHGNPVTRVQLSPDQPISHLTWNCEKFNMEEKEEVSAATTATTTVTAANITTTVSAALNVGDDLTTESGPRQVQSCYSNVLAVCYENGDIHLIRGHDDVSPVHIQTNLKDLHAEWNNVGELLAVGGHLELPGSGSSGDLKPVRSGDLEPGRSGNLEPGSTTVPGFGEGESCPDYNNQIKFYKQNGDLIYCVQVPTSKGQRSLSALTWGHNDKRLFVATGAQVHIGWMNKRIGSLQILCRLKILNMLKNVNQVDQLPLPCRLKFLITNLFTQSIKCHAPERKQLRQFVNRPPQKELRHYCTMIRHGDEFTGPSYTIYLEHLGGFLPILKGKKTSRLKPEFVIFDPTKDVESGYSSDMNRTDSNQDCTDTDTDLEESSSSLGWHSPRLRRKKKKQRSPQENQYFGYTGNADIDYVNNLPEEGRMVGISSNIWGTKFKIHGLDTMLPTVIGQISYKASLLHLQPRQMRLILTELRDDVLMMENCGKYLTNSFSEEEDDKLSMEEDLLTAVTQKDYPVVAPLPSIANRLSVVDFQKICPTRPETLNPESQNTKTSANQIKQKLPELSISSVSADVQTSEKEIFSIKEISLVSQKDVFVAPCPSTSTVDNQNFQVTSMNPESTQGQGLNLFDPRVVNSSSNSSPSICSPSRWAAKAEELRDIDASPTKSSNPDPSTTSFSATMSPKNMSATDQSRLLDGEGTSSTNCTVDGEGASSTNCTVEGWNSCVRSCSVDQLGAIVDILGVPSSASHLWDNARRLVLSVEKKKRRRQPMPASFTTCAGSSHNQNCQRLVSNPRCSNPTPAVKCPTNHISTLYSVNPIKFDGCSKDFQRRNKLAKSSSFDVETLFRSSEEMLPGGAPIQICQSCKLSYPGKDIELSDEMFDGVEEDDTEAEDDSTADNDHLPEEQEDKPLLPPPSPRSSRRLDSVRSLLERAKLKLGSRGRSETRESSERLDEIQRFNPSTPVHKRYSDRLQVPEQVQLSHSSPNTPLMARKRKTKTKTTSFSPVRTILSSPLLRRKKTSLEAGSEEDINHLHKRLTGREKKEGGGITDGGARTNYVNLETFQKQKLRHKLRQLSTQEGGEDLNSWSPDSSPKLSPRNARVSPRMCRELVLHNKAPLWNESSQVYQLDFGGRVTQESAKNFQIEHAGTQVMQFGRIDSNAYTLDFQYPFSAVQAFAVALANVTQRLK